MIDYLRRTPGVRDVVVSGGDVANLPWKNLEAYVARLLEIENIRDIRLATKALMGLPQHWLQTTSCRHDPPGRHARERGVSIAIHTHVNTAQSVTPLVAEASRAMMGGRRARRAQPGRPDAGGQRLGRAAARPLLRAARWRRDHAVLLLHVRHDPVQRALAGQRQAGAAPAARADGLPPRLRDPAHRLRRPVRREALGAPARLLRRGPRRLLLDEELPHRPSRRRPGRDRPDATSTTTRSTRCRPRARRGGTSTAWSPSSGPSPRRRRRLPRRAGRPRLSTPPTDRTPTWRGAGRRAERLRRATHATRACRWRNRGMTFIDRSVPRPPPPPASGSPDAWPSSASPVSLQSASPPVAPPLRAPPGQQPNRPIDGRRRARPPPPPHRRPRRSTVGRSIWHSGFEVVLGQVASRRPLSEPRVVVEASFRNDGPQGRVRPRRGRGPESPGVSTLV